MNAQGDKHDHAGPIPHLAAAGPLKSARKRVSASCSAGWDRDDRDKGRQRGHHAYSGVEECRSRHTNYDAISEKLDVDNNPPEGLIAHSAGRVDGLRMALRGSRACPRLAAKRWA